MRCGTPVNSPGFFVGSPRNQVVVEEHCNDKNNLDGSPVRPSTPHDNTEISPNHEIQVDELTEPKEDSDGHGNKDIKPVSKLTGRQYLVLATICLSSLCGATFYSLLAPFFPTEVRLICNSVKVFPIPILQSNYQ